MPPSRRPITGGGGRPKAFLRAARLAAGLGAKPRPRLSHASNCVDVGSRGPVGSRVPAYASSMGKLLLANLPQPEQRELLMGMVLGRLGPNTIVSKRTLRAELDQIEREAFAVDDEELSAGAYSIAGPVRNTARELVAAVTIEADSSMISLEGLVDALGPHLLSTADQISAHLGYRREDETPGSGPRRSVTAA